MKTTDPVLAACMVLVDEHGWANVMDALATLAWHRSNMQDDQHRANDLTTLDADLTRTAGFCATAHLDQHHKDKVT